MLAQKNRLGHSDALRTVIRKGKMFRAPGLLLRTRRTQEQEIRFAVAISEKAEKRAVNRNRVRRQIYGFLRTNLTSFPSGFDCYITVQKPAFSQTAKERKEHLRRALTKAGLFT